MNFLPFLILCLFISAKSKANKLKSTKENSVEVKSTPPLTQSIANIQAKPQQQVLIKTIPTTSQPLISNTKPLLQNVTQPQVQLGSALPPQPFSLTPTQSLSPIQNSSHFGSLPKPNFSLPKFSTPTFSIDSNKDVKPTILAVPSATVTTTTGFGITKPTLVEPIKPVSAVVTADVTKPAIFAQKTEAQQAPVTSSTTFSFGSGSGFSFGSKPSQFSLTPSSTAFGAAPSSLTFGSPLAQTKPINEKPQANVVATAQTVSAELNKENIANSEQKKEPAKLEFGFTQPKTDAPFSGSFFGQKATTTTPVSDQAPIVTTNKPTFGQSSIDFGTTLQASNKTADIQKPLLTNIVPDSGKSSPVMQPTVPQSEVTASFTFALPKNTSVTTTTVTLPPGSTASPKISEDKIVPVVSATLPPPATTISGPSSTFVFFSSLLFIY